MRTETATTWSNPDGTMTTEAHAATIRYKDNVGRWQPVDLTLVKGADGGVAARSHPGKLKLGNRAAVRHKPFAAVQAGSDQTVEWLAPWKLPEPVLSGTAATYREVEPGIDLVVHSRRTGFEHDFVVKTRPTTAPIWRIPMRIKGLTVRPRVDGSTDFVDSTGRVRSTIPVAEMWDAEKDASTGEYLNRSRVRVTVEQTAGAATLVVAPDEKWILSPDRRFPVTVDPTYAQASTFATFDTGVQSNVTVDQSSSPELHAGYNGQWTARSFLNFPLDSIKAKQIVGASLSLHEIYSQSCTPSVVVARNSGSGTTATRWDNQPALYSAQGSASVAKGFSGSCPAGRVLLPITDVVRNWSTLTYQTASLALLAGNETDANSWKRFSSLETENDPYITFTWNRTPTTPTAPTFTTATSYAPPGSSASSLYTAYTKPWATTKASDADANLLRYDLEFHASTTATTSTLKGSCSSVTYPSGTTAGCSPSGDLPNDSTIYARARSYDGRAFSAWSGWTSVRVAASTPTAPLVSCPSPFAKNSWQDNIPTGSAITCTITASGAGFNAPAYVRATVDGKPYATNFAGGAAGQIKINPSSDPTIAKTSVTIKLPSPSGLHTVQVRSESPSGRTSIPTDYNFGWGGTALIAPSADPRISTVDTIAIHASGPPRGASSVPTAKLRWRLSGYGSTNDETVGWNEGSSLQVSDLGASGVDVTGSWDTNEAVEDTLLDSDPLTAGVQGTLIPGTRPVLLDIQVCLTYTTTVQCTWSQQRSTVRRIPHAFGGDFPVAEAGPGTIALWTGEFSLDATDAAIAAHQGELSISRSHSTFAGPADETNSIFGPGWAAQLDGPESGFAGVQVIDSSRLDGTISFLDGADNSLAFSAPDGKRRTSAALQAGTWVPANAETVSSQIKLTVVGSGPDTKLTLGYGSGETTTFILAAPLTATADGKFKPDSVAEAELNSSARYLYRTPNPSQVERIVAASPPGTTCVSGNEYVSSVACRSLRFEYGTGALANRLIAVWLDAYNPHKTGGAGMDSIRLAAYSYDASGRLASVNDPRSNLSTAYEYDSANRVVSVTPAGQNPYRLNYVGSGEQQRLASVTRERPETDPAGGTATVASYVYGVPTSGLGLPDLSSTSISRWGQRRVPSHGFAVFGPDHPAPGSTPGEVSESDWAYADLSFTDDDGTTLNTAHFGSGAWQYTSVDFDTQGNVVRTLDQRAIRSVIDDSLPPANADLLATITVYNEDIKGADNKVLIPAGRRVTDTFGPAHYATLGDRSRQLVRAHRHVSFDEGAPNGGMSPVSNSPYGLITKETLSTYRVGAGVDEVHKQTIFDYTAPEPADEDGWETGRAGAVVNDLDLDGQRSAADISRVTRYDDDGRIVESRQPASSGTDAGTTHTVYYTAAPNSTYTDCGNRPFWAGQICRVQSAALPTSAPGQPGTPQIPATVTSEYDYLLNARTVIQSAGSVTRTSTTTYLLDGRSSGTKTTIAGLPSSHQTTSKHVAYAPATGLVATLTAKKADGTTASKISTGYDSWGRKVSYQVDTETPTTTTYNAAGAIGEISDANGTTSYSYDGTDATGQVEHRGLATRVDVTSGSQTWTSTVAYDPAGALNLQKLPGGITRTTKLDLVGNMTGLEYTGQLTVLNEDGSTSVTTGGWLSWSQDRDIAGRVTHEWTPEGAAFAGQTGDTQNDVGDAVPYDRAFKYDPEGRLIQINDRTAGVDANDSTQSSTCTTRSYSFDANTNRRSLTTSPSGVDGSCTNVGGVTRTSEYDTADRPTSGANNQGSYSYDAFGRTLAIPAVDAPTPQAGDISLSYYDNDSVRSISQGGTSSVFELDAMDRRHVQTTTQGTQSDSTVRHYSNESDNPTWITTSTKSYRYAQLLDGQMLTVSTSGSLAITNPHADIVATVALATTQSTGTSLSGWSMFDEYGNPADANTAETGPGQYGWVGANQRQTADVGLLLMGARVYNPATGLFTSQDPVRGGGANATSYCDGDPINCSDVSGLFTDMLTYDLGWYPWSPSYFMIVMMRCFTCYFTFDGATTPRPGRAMNLYPLGKLKSFPVLTTRIWRNQRTAGFQFLALKGHPDVGGFIRFTFFKVSGSMLRIQIYYYVPNSSPGGWAGKWAYRKIAKNTWAPFLTNLVILVYQLRLACKARKQC